MDEAGQMSLRPRRSEQENVRVGQSQGGLPALFALHAHIVSDVGAPNAESLIEENKMLKRRLEESQRREEELKKARLTPLSCYRAALHMERGLPDETIQFFVTWHEPQQHMISHYTLGESEDDVLKNLFGKIVGEDLKTSILRPVFSDNYLRQSSPPQTRHGQTKPTTVTYDDIRGIIDGLSLGVPNYGGGIKFRSTES